MMAKRVFWVIALAVVATVFATACNSSARQRLDVQAQEAEGTEPDASDEHAEDGHADTHSPDQHMAGAHDVPEEAAAVPNPIAADQASIATGGELYGTNCAVCHGETGQGDGPGAAGLEKKPAILTEAHVQELSDGALFYIISHGRPETPMPAWEDILSEDERWQVINYLRTFEVGGAEGDHEAGEHDEEGEHADDSDDHNEGEHDEEGEHDDEGEHNEGN